MTREVGSYDEDNAETARFAGDDVGLPESPIYSNFSNKLWRTHTRHGLMQSPDGEREDTSGHRPTQDE
ncbi:MAG TPA: hypothetical protein VGB73_13420 [Pyrinomonadaceae bacterium]|jgi:hypothetical protein